MLIPRQETEILVDLIAKKLGGDTISGKTLWDICTGSGCIGLALKKALPELDVTLSDICPKALSVARRNAEANGVGVGVRQGDLLELLLGTDGRLPGL